MAFSNPGMRENVAPDRELYLKLWSGMVLVTLQNKLILRQYLNNIMPIRGGKSYLFDLVGPTTAKYHIKTTEDRGVAQFHNQKEIELDDFTTAATEIAEIDQIINHFMVNPIYAYNHGEALARSWEWSAIIEIIKAARSAALVTGDYAGTIITDANLDAADEQTKGEAMLSFIRQASAAMDAKNVPDENRYVLVNPQQWHTLIALPDKIVNIDYRGEGSIATGTLRRYDNITILKSNMPPYGVNVVQGSAEDAGITQAQNWFHYADATNTRMLMFHSDVLGILEAMSATSKDEYYLAYLSSLLKSYGLWGFGFLKPSHAVEGVIA